ncbi:MAG: site-specific integrase [Proteobacteria bacterium]|nr:site-specific integrase [Pseudomonadota bacterium]
MTVLRQDMIRPMKVRNFSVKTQDAYLYHIDKLARHYKRSPDKLSHVELQDYLIYMKESIGLSFSSCNVARSAIRFLYRNILNDETIAMAIPAQRTPKHLPEVLSFEEVMVLINGTKCFRDRLLLMTAYSSGLRLEELVSLKLEHIDSKRMVIRVVQGKGNKDRYTTLSENLLKELREYWRIYKPKDWLFYSTTPENPLSKSSAQKIFSSTKKRTGITRGHGIHTLRHCFATHMLEAGYDIHRIQRMLGHKNLATTMIYLHVTRESISKIKSPLDIYMADEPLAQSPWEDAHDPIDE